MTYYYKVINDLENVYEQNSIISSDTLINDFLEICNDTEDAELIGWIYSLQQTNTEKTIAQAIAFIADAWNIQLEKITKN